MKIIAISDTHGYFQSIPECDLLIVAGDICPDKIYRGVRGVDFPELQLDWVKKAWLDWRVNQPAKVVAATWGNHDFGGLTQPQNPWVPEQNTTFIVDGLFEFGGLKIWFSPWSKTFHSWAFMGSEDDLAERYKPIPEGIDILVTHGPPYGYGDMNEDGHRCGSKALLDTIGRVKPKAVICGHIHEAFGSYEMHDGITVYNVAQAGHEWRKDHKLNNINPVEITLNT